MCQCSKLLLLSACLALNLYFVICFNVDSYNYAIYDGPDSSSMFGFSIAVHRETNNGWLIVGAPDAQSSYQRQVYRGGAVYKCPVDRDGSCLEIPFDTRANNRENNHDVDNKTQQWFGATVSASGSNGGPVVACAPRYTWFAKQNNHIDPVGTCYVSNGVFNNFEEYSPCRTFRWGIHRQGSCQAGFSAAINSVGDRLFIGAPGSWYWQGQMYSIDGHATFDYVPHTFTATYGNEGQVHQQSLETRPAVISTPEGTEPDDNSYMGYSIITGDFTGNGEEGIAVGRPKGNQLNGVVLLFTWNLTNYRNFTSDQIGSYFGYALAAADVDGDQKVDLIVGSPMFTPINNEGKYDVGQVRVIYHNSKKGVFNAYYDIVGFNSKSRFGQALASLGDINQDGYGDFAVGAPYDGKDERGAIYIYHGSNKGVRVKYSQVIFAEDVLPGPRTSLSTFGFAITGGLDLDGNEYPDMAVGAYLSSKAFFFRSRPVVRIEAYVKFLTANKQVDIKQSNYRLRNGVQAIKTNIDFCIKYYGKGIPQYIDLNLQYVLDTKSAKNPRMGFVDNENMNRVNDTIRLYKGKPDTCKQKYVYIKTDIKDKLTPLEAEVKYWMQEETRSSYELQRNPRSSLKPILDLNSPPSRKDSISIQKNCGSDNVCIPNLHLNVTSNVDQYLLGSQEKLVFDVIVTNFGEDSFETIFEVKYAEYIYYHSTKDVKTDSHILCNTHSNNTVKCEIGNPIPAEKIVRFKIFWQTQYNDGMAPSYEFDMFVNSTNKEHDHTLYDNHKHLSVGIWSNSKLELRGKSYPSDVFYNVSQYASEESEIRKENEIGPQVIHVYYLRNEGPATIQETEMFFVWPTATLGGEDLLYLLEQPKIHPDHTNAKCDLIDVNKKHYEVDYKKSVWERLNIDTRSGSASSFHSSSGSSSSSSSSIDGGIVYGEVSGSSSTATSNNNNNLQNENHSSGDSSSIYASRKQQQQQHTSNNNNNNVGDAGKGGITNVYTYNQTIIRDQYGNIIKSTNTGNLTQDQYNKMFGSSNNNGVIASGTYYQGGGRGGAAAGTVVHQSSSSSGSGGQIAGSRIGNHGSSSGSSSHIGNVNYNQQQSGGGYQNTGGRHNEGTNREGGGSYYEQRGGGSSYGGGVDNRGNQGQSSSGTGVFYQSGHNNYDQRGSGIVHQQSNINNQQSNGGGYSYQQGYDQNRGSQHHIQRTGTDYNRGGQSTIINRGFDHSQGQSNTQNHQGSVGAGDTEDEDYEDDYDEEENEHMTGYYDSNGQHISTVVNNQNKTSTSQSAGVDFGEIAGGRNFRTFGFDLGRSNNNNNGVSQVSSTGTGAGGLQTTTLDLGTNRGQFNITEGLATEQQIGQNRGQDGQRQWQTEHHWSRTYDIPVTHYNSNNINIPTTERVERDNVPSTDGKSNPRRFYGRRKRQIHGSYEEISKQIDCISNPCVFVRCTVGPLKRDQEISIALRSRVNVRALRKVTTSHPVNISSKMAARISRLQYIGTPVESNFEKYEIVTNIAAPEADIKPDIVPLWVVVLSAVVGTIILLLLVFLLYKLGFFKRNRPSNAPERQPLNRNGYHHGDEAL